MVKGFKMKLYEGQEAEYERRHNLLWPEMKDMIHEHGGKNYTIFLDKETLTLFGYIEIEDELYQKALKEAGEEQAMIFDVHKMMLDDADYLDSIRGLIRDEKMNAEFAVNLTGENFAGIFASMDDEYMKARSADVLDISKRLIRILAGVGEEGIAS